MRRESRENIQMTKNGSTITCQLVTNTQRGSKSPSPTRAASSSPKRASSAKMSDSRPQSGKSKSPSPSRKSSAKSRSSSRKRDSVSPGGKKSKSPSPNRKGTSSASSRGRSAGKKKVRVKSPSRTQSGLKIRDLSDQGLTAVPPNLLAEKDLGIVNLSGNNLKTLPPEITRWDKLEKLDLSKNYGLRRTKANDNTSLPQEILTLVNLRELIISECNLQRLPTIIWQMTNLHVLDVSRNKINILVPEVGNLSNLRKINLKHTNITSLPPEIVYCQDLEEILLWGNKISTLPETLPELLKLKTLGLNYRDFCGQMDAMREKFLNTGQVKSDYIPQIVFDLPALESLDLEGTKINNMPETTNHGLRELNLSRNFLNVLPRSVYNLNHLTLLNLSDNQFSSLPDELGNLKSLTKLRLANNQIHFLPLTIGNLKNLKELDVSFNRLKRLPINIKGLKNLKYLHAEKNDLTAVPDEICELVELETLNLTENNIHTLPMRLHRLTKLKDAHVYDRYNKHGLWLYKNPLTTPPMEIWRTDKTEKIFDYLKKLAIIKTENLQRQKMLVLGESQCGKSTLMMGLVHGISLSSMEEDDKGRKSKQEDMEDKRRKSYESNIENLVQENGENQPESLPPTNKTEFIEQTIWKTENMVEFVINDFGGDDAYRISYPLFLDANALVLLVYDHSEYSKETHQTSIGQWLDLLSRYTPGVAIKLVGTKTDLCEDSFTVEETEDLVQELVQEHLENYLGKLQMELSNVEKDLKEAISSSNEEYMTHLRNLKEKLEYLISKPVKIIPEIATVSSQEGLPGVSKLINSIELLAIDTELFPHGQRCIPDLWNKLRARLKRRSGYYLSWEVVEKVASISHIKEESLESALQYLHDIGEVMWFKNNPGLSKILFHKPRLLVDLITSLYHHNFEEFFNYDENKIFMSMGKFNKDTFNEAVEIFVKYGQISRPLLSCLWFNHRLTDSKFTELLELMPYLDICYTIPQPEVPTGNNIKLPLMVLPWYNKEMAENDLVEDFEKSPPENIKPITLEYKFPLRLPMGVFERISACLQDYVLSRIDWKNAVYATLEDANFLLLCSASDLSSCDSIELMIKGQSESLPASSIRTISQIIANTLLKVEGLVWKIKAPKDAWLNQVIQFKRKDITTEE
ncbi:malignant fibrous histiocytoma-amplified sequence 1 homolog [Saccostrea echinata]|uniref:malignant fibrous histiocytoma-amplified sequence 1 homolog n=1 Tax=Saccostrea echinata TaxID=191078 RepID=UPI002A841D6B|nr:malignant fibrous histiocytoma-amplified sequence 1 homolog [Saccostrea echinata]